MVDGLFDIKSLDLLLASGVPPQMKVQEVVKPPNRRDHITYELTHRPYRPVIIEHDGGPIY